MNSSSHIDAATLEKTFRINMDKRYYGAFAEIGAGQETANWFFRASGAAGTVAKTISAYDMTVSDALYGPVSRYVSEERLLQMMDYEYKQILDRLSEKRGDNTCFFAFCNTVKSKGYKDNGPWSAWLGIRFQLKPGAPPSDFVMHVRLLVPDHDRQVKILGVLGVNMLHALFYKKESAEEFIPALGANLDTSAFEINMVRFSGHGFEKFDNRILTMQLVQSGLAQSILFCPDGRVVQPSDFLYKRPIILLRGSFKPLCNIHLEMMESVKRKFLTCLTEKQNERMVEICEVSLTNFLRGKTVDPLDFIDRLDALAAQGKMVMVTNMRYFHRISGLLNQFTREPIAVSLSIGLLHEIFNEKWTEPMNDILSQIGSTFINETRFYVTPWINRTTGEFVTAGTYRPVEQYKFLYQHLMANDKIIEVPYFNQKLLFKTSRDIIQMIHEDNEEWKEYVPEASYRMVEMIREEV